MPCTKCKDENYKWGKTGSCKYATKEECERANPKKYNKMNPTPIGKKTYEEYAKELKEFKNKEELHLSKVYKIKLTIMEDIEDKISQGLGLVEFVEEDLDKAFEFFIRAKDTVRFDMNDAYADAEFQLNEFIKDIKELGLDIPPSVKQLQKDLDLLEKAIDESEQRIKDF